MQSVCSKFLPQVNQIHKYYINPKTKTPHPVARIDAAIDDVKYHVDGDKPVDKQVQEIVKKILTVIPLKKSEVTGTIKISHTGLGAAGWILVLTYRCGIAQICYN